MINRRFFTLYQYAGPLILTPLSFWLWWRTYHGDLALVLVAWLIPILFAYIVPAVGTNVLKVWEFNTRYRLGRFRPHHGFVFGSATAMIAWTIHTRQACDLFGILQSAFIMASVLGFWNLIYDIKALKAGILLVYNQPWADGESEEAVAMDYAPVFFAGFGLLYGTAIAMAEWMYHKGLWSAITPFWYLPVALILAIAFPVWLYRVRSFKRHGHSGCRPIKRQ